jgi:hypothetical protein
MAVDSPYLRMQAGRMLDLALKTRDAELSEKLAIRAAEYLDEAMELERIRAAIPQKPEPEPA